jgi:hypothetical protein
MDKRFQPLTANQLQPIGGSWKLQEQRDIARFYDTFLTSHWRNLKSVSEVGAHTLHRTTWEQQR